MSEQMLVHLDYLYNEAMLLKDYVQINGVSWHIVDAELSENILGLCSHDTIFINKKLSNKEKQKIIFHELIHSWLITFSPENNNEENVRELEMEYYENRLQKTKQYIIVP